MFDKRKEAARPGPTPPAQTAGQSVEPRPSDSTRPPAPSAAAIVGAALVMNGELSGNEDIVVAGRFEGKITLPSNSVMVSKGGQVHADVLAKVVQIEGQMTGDIQGGERVVITATGQMEGKISAPRVVLIDGAKFKGSIDMDSPGNAPAARSRDATAPAKSLQSTGAQATESASRQAAGQV